MSNESLYDIFLANLEQFGENCAVIFNDGETVKKANYSQIATESRKVASCLRELCADGFVGLIVEQDLSLPSLILGILHNNLPFTCIDIEDSQEKIIQFVKYLCIKWVFTKSSCQQVKNILANYGNEIKTIFLHGNSYSIWHIDINYVIENKIFPLLPTLNLAYAIQTSGSTGKPKIIFVPHQSIVPNILDIREVLQVHPSDIVFLASPLTFDPSIVELFVPLICGAAVLIVPSLVKALPSVLLEILFPTHCEFYSGASILQITPSLFSRWNEHDIQTKILSKTTTLKKLLFGGEPCPNITILRSWKAEDNSTEIYNIYGITEVSCWACIEKINFSPNINQFGQPEVNAKVILDVPLGSPLSKTDLQVRNDQGDQIFNGEGELYIGSSERICLINEEILEKLSPPVFRATGDIVKMDKSHNRVMFVGRKNRIIKRWGHRVCLNDVERILSKHLEVEKCSCIWNQLKNILAVAVVWRDKEEKQNLRLYSVNHLHKAAVPDKIVTVNVLPLTNHGKIDYEKLQSIILHKNDEEAIKEMPVSSHIRQIWRNIVGREPLLSEKFMSSGGNSLLAIQFTSELERNYGEKIRNKMMNMLLNNASVLEIEKFLLGPHNESETQIDSGKESSLGSMKGISSFDKETPFGNTESHEHLLLSDENKHTFVNSSKKRKLLSDFPQDLKQNKMETLEKISSSSKDKNPHSLMQDDEVLIKVCCRGTTIQKETQFDSGIIEEDNKLFLHLNWKFDMHKCVDASPCFLKFTKRNWVVVGSHSHQLVVLQCSSGEVISQCELPDRIESSVCPSACGKYGVVGCYNGCIYCISLAKGEIVWTFCTNGMVKSTPVLSLDNTAAIVGSYDSSLYCITMEDGNLIWKVSPSSASIYASACISSNMVYTATLDGTCVSLSAKTGKLQWKTQISSPVFSSPVLVHSNKCIIFTEVLGFVHCFSTANGDQMWQFKASGQVFSSFSTLHYSLEQYELLVFGSHDKNVYCLKWDDNAQDVSLKWKQELDSAVFATPFIYKVKAGSNSHSTSAITNTYVITATSKGLLYVLKGKDGSIKCIEPLPNEIFSSPVICDGQVFIGCRDNYLYSYSLSSTKIL